MPKWSEVGTGLPVYAQICTPPPNMYQIYVGDDNGALIVHASPIIAILLDSKGNTHYQTELEVNSPNGHLDFGFEAQDIFTARHPVASPFPVMSPAFTQLMHECPGCNARPKNDNFYQKRLVHKDGCSGYEYEECEEGCDCCEWVDE